MNHRRAGLINADMGNLSWRRIVQGKKEQVSATENAGSQ
jgi:hypothetical protein